MSSQYFWKTWLQILPKGVLHCVKREYNLNGLVCPLGHVCSVDAEEETEFVNVRVNFSSGETHSE